MASLIYCCPAIRNQPSRKTQLEKNMNLKAEYPEIPEFQKVELWSKLRLY